MPTRRPRPKIRRASQPAPPAPSTRERILEAAFAVLSQQGLSSLTLRAVADTAGVALGLVSYHFANKQALLLELIAASRARFLGELAERARPATTAALLRQLLELTRALPAFMPGWFRLNADLDSLALGDATLLTAAAENKRRGAADTGQYLEQLASAAQSELAQDELRALIDVMYAAFDGLALRSMIDDTLDLPRAYAEAERILLMRIAPGMQPHPEPWNEDPLSGASPAPFVPPMRKRASKKPRR